VISAALHDLGTKARHTADVVPGMDALRWAQRRCEYSVATPLPTDFERRLRAEGPQLVAMQPWPLPFRGVAPVDLTDRYRALTLRLHQWDQDGQRWAPAPAGDNRLDATDGAVSSRPQWRHSRTATVAEQQANPAQVPTEWVRQPIGNEVSACALKPPVELRWHGLPGCRYTVELRDNLFFAPFDLSQPERYQWVGDDHMDLEDGHRWATWGDGARLRLYLRPRTWKIWARTIAHYVAVNFFEMYYSDEVFTRVYWDRPPFEPVRQNIVVTGESAEIWYEWFGGLYCSYDQGIEWAFEHSVTAAEMRHEIVQQQWWSPCAAYVLMDVEGAVLVIDAVAPQPGETVLGIEREDLVSGRASRVWAVQQADVSSVYPTQAVGTYIAEGWY